MTQRAVQSVEEAKANAANAIEKALQSAADAQQRVNLISFFLSVFFCYCMFIIFLINPQQ